MLAVAPASFRGSDEDERLIGVDVADEPIDLVVEDHPEACVIRIRSRLLLRDEQIDALRQAVYRHAQSGGGRLILDFAAVEYFSSVCIGLLVTLRKELRGQVPPSEPPFQFRRRFTFFSSVEEALEAIRQGERDPLVLCGVRRELAEILLL